LHEDIAAMGADGHANANHPACARWTLTSMIFMMPMPPTRAETQAIERGAEHDLGLRGGHLGDVLLAGER